MKMTPLKALLLGTAAAVGRGQWPLGRRGRRCRYATGLVARTNALAKERKGR